MRGELFNGRFLAAVEETAPEAQETPKPKGDGTIWGTGRRKAAVARVRVRPGTGRILVNVPAAPNQTLTGRERSRIGQGKPGKVTPW